MENLNEAKNIPTVALQLKEGPEGTVIPVAKAINIVLNTKGTITGMDEQGNIHLKNANDNNYILAQGGRTTLRWQGPLPQLVLDGQQVINKINSYKCDDIAKEKAEQYCKEQGLRLTDSGEFQINGLIDAQDANGKKYMLKVTSDPEDEKEYIVEPFTITENNTLEPVKEEPKETAAKEDNIKATNNAYSNTLSQKDVMLVGGELTKYFRKLFRNYISRDDVPLPFKDVSVQITTGSRQQESMIVKYHKLLEATDKNTVETLRVNLTFIPTGAPTDWNSESLEQFLKTASEKFIEDHVKGVTFKDENDKFLVSFSDANNVKCTDGRGYAGYFDVYATKVFKPQSAVGKIAGKAIDALSGLSNVKNAENKGYGHN